MAQKIDQTQISAPPYAAGGMKDGTGSGVRGLDEQTRSGINFDGSGTYTVTTKGLYYMHFSQLVQMSATALYMNLQINGSTVKQGYNTGNMMYDLQVADMRELNVGDTIRVQYSVNQGNTWSGPHSNYQIYLVTAT